MRAGLIHTDDLPRALAARLTAKAGYPAAAAAAVLCDASYKCCIEKSFNTNTSTILVLRIWHRYSCIYTAGQKNHVVVCMVGQNILRGTLLLLTSTWFDTSPRL